MAMTIKRKRRLASASALALVLTGCGGGGSGGSGAAPSPPIATPAPPPAPLPPPAPPPLGTPFGVTANQVFTTFGWTFREGVSSPSAAPADMMGIRWRADLEAHEILPPGFTEWLRLQLADRGSTDTSASYNVIAPNGAVLPMTVFAQPRRNHVGIARWYYYDARPTGQIRSSIFAYGLDSPSGAVPTTGTGRYRSEHGWVELDFDFQAGTLSGRIGLAWVDDWGPYAPTYYPLTDTSFSAGGRSFSARFSVPGAPSQGQIEGIFFGPEARELAVRWVGPVRNPYDNSWEIFSDVEAGPRS